MTLIRWSIPAFLSFLGISQGVAGSGAELVWPEDSRVFQAEVAGGFPGAQPFPTAWPISAQDLCPSDTACPADSRGPFAVTTATGFYGLRPSRSVGEPFETFAPGWGSVRTDPELARAWTRIPALAQIELRHAFSPAVFAYFRMGLRRDFSAWVRDDLALNIPLSTKEVDLNEPSLGYLNYSGEWMDFTVGRLPVHWSPSPDFGLTLTDAVPYHNAVQAVLKAPRLRYRFLVSSLNPWLEGTPTTTGSGVDYPVGSEEWRQRNYPVRPGSENAHKRVYDARVKTLIAHRLESWAGPLTVGVTETQVVGGKVPDLRDANPFAIFHNDFHEGHANNSVSVDAVARLPFGFSLAAEILMDDLEWSDTEGEGASPSLLGYLGGLRHAITVGGWGVVQCLHAIRTDPFLYGSLQPLNTYSSRHVITSNNQVEGDPVFVDKYVVDYPIGYLRGGDAFDFWYRAEAVRGRRLRLGAEAAWLNRGESGSQVLFERYYQPHGSSPSGVAERELRVTLRGGWRPLRPLDLVVGVGWSSRWNAGHVEGRQKDSPLFSAGIGWTR